MVNIVSFWFRCSVLLAAVAVICLAQDECPLALAVDADISYVEIREDEDYSYKLKGKGLYKKSKGLYNIQSNRNDVFQIQQQQQVNAPVIFQQQQRQQQQQQGAPKQRGTEEESDTSNQTATNDTTVQPGEATTAAPKVEIKWHLTLPRSTLAVWGARMEQTGVLAVDEAFSYSMDGLRKRNLLTLSGTSIVVDLTELDFKPFEWYIVCAKQGLVSEGKLQQCQHCSLVKSSGPSDDEDVDFGVLERATKALKLNVVDGSISATSATLLIQVLNLPVPAGAAVIIKAIPKPRDKRCRSNGNSGILRHTDPVYPNTATVRTLTGLNPELAYQIELDLVIPLSKVDGKQMGLKSESLVLRRYISTNQFSGTIPKCG